MALGTLRKTCRIVLPAPVGGAAGWAAGATAGAPAIASLDSAGLLAWLSVPFNWSFIVITVAAAWGTFEALKERFEDASQPITGEDIASLKDELLTEVKRGAHDQAMAELAAGTASPDLLAKYRQILAAAESSGEAVSATAVAEAAITAQNLAESDDPRERAIADLVGEGRFREAARQRAALAEAQLAEAGKPIAEQFREAGRLALPFKPSEALEYFTRAAQIDPEDVWGWIELGRLRAQYETLGSARNCFGQALQHVTDQRDRMVLHNEFGDVLVSEGHLPEARHEFEAALSIAQRLADSDPHNTGWQRDLSVIFNKLGDLERGAGNLVGARTRFEAALAIAQQLADSDPQHAGWQRDLSVSHDKLGDLERYAGNLAEAWTRFEASLAIAQMLADSDPHNAGWQLDLSVSHERLGDLESSAGNLAEARTRCEASLAIRQRLADSDPHNTEWQRDLSVSQNKLGDLERSAGNLTEARASFKVSLAIRQRLADSDPHNTGWQRDLSVSYERLGDLAADESHFAEALEQYRASLLVAAQLAAQWPDHPQFVADLNITRRRIAELEEQLSAKRG